MKPSAMQFFACFSEKIKNGISTGPKGQFKIPYILHLGISRNLLSTSKLRIFQIPPDGVLQQSRKILCEIHKKLHNLKMRGSASSPDDFDDRFGLDGIQKPGTNV